MVGLDRQQLEILKKLGIDVWQRRDQQTVSVESQVVEVSEAGGDGPIGLPEMDGNVAGGGKERSSLSLIAKQINACQRCKLHETRNNTVPGTGDPHADWMFIGEAPGQNEDQQGLPFVGKAGKLLDAMIAALEMKREAVFIANVIKCRPRSLEISLHCRCTWFGHLL